jgi:hypothetical protein
MDETVMTPATVRCAKKWTCVKQRSARAPSHASMEAHTEPGFPPREPVEECTEALGKMVEDLRAECRPVRILRCIVKVAEQRRVERDLERLLGHSGASSVRHSSRSGKRAQRTLCGIPPRASLASRPSRRVCPVQGVECPAQGPATERVRRSARARYGMDSPRLRALQRRCGGGRPVTRTRQSRRAPSGHLRAASSHTFRDSSEHKH